MFVGQDAAPLLGSAEDAPVARLAVLSEVNVLEEEGDRVRVEVTGWADVDAEGKLRGEVFTNRTDRMRIATLEDPSAASVLASEDGWQELRLSGSVALAALVEDAGSLGTRARQLYQQQCATCHAGYAPQLEAIIRAREPHQWLERRAHARESGITEANLNLFLRWAQEQSKAHQAEASSDR